MLFDEADLDGAQEVPVQAGVDDEDENLTDLVPDVVDLDEGLADWWDGVRWNPDTEDGDVDAGDQDHCSPFEVADCTSVFCDEGNAVDDDLHEQLDLPHPEEQDEEKDGNTTILVSMRAHSVW